MLISTADAGSDTKSDTIWCFVTDEANTPIVEKSAHTRTSPRYQAIIWFTSSFPQNEIKIGKKMLGAITASEVMNAASVFPVTTAVFVTGSVISVSREPERFSSEYSFIVKIGTKSVSKIDWNKNIMRISALLYRKKL